MNPRSNKIINVTEDLKKKCVGGADIAYPHICIQGAADHLIIRAYN